MSLQFEDIPKAHPPGPQLPHCSRLALRSVRIAPLVLVLCLLWIAGNTVAGQPPGFMIRTSAKDHSFTFFLNDEPIAVGESPGVAVVRGFPLRPGTNYVRSQMRFPRKVARAEDNDSLNFQSLAVVALLQSAKDWTVVRKLTKVGPFEDLVQWDFHFVITNWSGSAEVPFEKLESVGDSYKDRTAEMAAGLARLWRDRDRSALAKAVGDVGGDQSKQMGPPWLFDSPRDQITIQAVSNASDVAIVSGNYWVLASAKPNGAALAAAHLVDARLSNPERLFTIDCVRFARRNGVWGLISSEGDWVQVDLAAWGRRAR